MSYAYYKMYDAKLSREYKTIEIINNLWVKEEIKREIRKQFKLARNENKPNCKIQLKQGILWYQMTVLEKDRPT